MTPFDITVSLTMPPSLGIPSEEQQAEGENTIELAFPVGIPLPFSADGTTPLTTPLGVLRFNLSRELAIELFKQGLAAAEGLPTSKTSSLLIANDPKAVEAQAERLSKIVGR